MVAASRRLLNDDRAVTCGPVLFEISRGLRSAERKRILGLLGALLRLSFEEAIWDAAGNLDALLRKRGLTLPPMDLLVAQLCLHHQVRLFTLDEHFQSVPGLRFFKP